MKESIDIYLPPVLQTDWFTVEQLHTYVLAYISCKIKSCKDAYPEQAIKLDKAWIKTCPNMYCLNYITIKKKSKIEKGKGDKM